MIEERPSPTNAAILATAADRLSFDAPIHSVEDVLALELEPRWLNIKPSRFGSARRLLDTIAYGEDHGMTLYGGGQFELGVGRSHIQTFASLYYADSANDVAPSLYNEPSSLTMRPQPVSRARRAEGLAFA